MSETTERTDCDECGAESSCYISDANGWIEWTCLECGQVGYTTE